MARAIVDPGELRRLARQLQQFHVELEEPTAWLANQMHSLIASWRDQEHEKFADEFEEHLKAIRRAIEATDQYAPFLIRKAERIEDYLEQR